MITPKPNHVIFIAGTRMPFYVREVIRGGDKSEVAVLKGNWGSQDRAGTELPPVSGRIVMEVKLEVATQFIVTQEPAE